jgi:hypothetical protein
MELLPWKKRPQRRNSHRTNKLIDRLADRLPDRLTNTTFLRPEAAPTSKRRFWLPSQPLLLVLSILAVLALAHLIATVHIPLTLDPNDAPSCATYLLRVDYTKIITLQPGQQMAAIQFTRAITGGQPSALVQVDENDPQQKIDVYLYGCRLVQGIPTPNLLFQQQGLIQGSVAITATHTLSIGLLDTTLKPEDSATLLVPQQQNVYREYAWQNGTLRQITFPGLYPVTSRSEAMALQDETQGGQPMIPWNDPLATAEQMAQDLFHWQNKEISGAIQDNNVIDAHVQLEQKITHQHIFVSLARLIQHDTRGLWFVTGAQTPGITLDQSALANVLTSPITLQGTITATHDPIEVTLFNHTLNAIRLHAGDKIQPNDDNTFKGSITYDSIFPNQSGLLLLQTKPDTESKESGYLYLTNVLLR